MFLSNTTCVDVIVCQQLTHFSSGCCHVSLNILYQPSSSIYAKSLRNKQFKYPAAIFTEYPTTDLLYVT
jgi:hypothetical protein